MHFRYSRLLFLRFWIHSQKLIYPLYTKSILYHCAHIKSFNFKSYLRLNAIHSSTVWSLYRPHMKLIFSVFKKARLHRIQCLHDLLSIVINFNSIYPWNFKLLFPYQKSNNLRWNFHWFCKALGDRIYEFYLIVMKGYP